MMIRTVIVFLVSIGLSLAFRFSVSSYRLRKCTNLLYSPTTEDINNIHSSISTEAFGAFFDSFRGRMFGTRAGNVASGFLLKFLSDAYQSWQEKQRRTKEVAVEPLPGVTPRVIPASAWAQLILCVIIDAVGDSSFVIPGFGELEDVAWAPLSAFLVSRVFDSNSLTGLEFLKEALPGTDIIPLASLAWLLTYVYPDNILTKLLGLPTLKTLPSESKKVVDTKEIKSDDKNVSV
jgi:hypothetical protein